MQDVSAARHSTGSMYAGKGSRWRIEGGSVYLLLSFIEAVET